MLMQANARGTRTFCICELSKYVTLHCIGMVKTRDVIKRSYGAYKIVQLLCTN